MSKYIPPSVTIEEIDTSTINMNHIRPVHFLISIRLKEVKAALSLIKTRGDTLTVPESMLNKFFNIVARHKLDDVIYAMAAMIDMQGRYLDTTKYADLLFVEKCVSSTPLQNLCFLKREKSTVVNWNMVPQGVIANNYLEKTIVFVANIMRLNDRFDDLLPEIQQERAIVEFGRRKILEHKQNFHKYLENKATLTTQEAILL